MTGGNEKIIWKPISPLLRFEDNIEALLCMIIATLSYRPGLLNDSV